MKNRIQIYLTAIVLVLLTASCQKMKKPDLGDYPKDSDPRFPLYPGGPLKFYAAFDGSTPDPLMNAVDSVRANFPSSNPLQSVTGISGKAIQGESQKFITYTSFNEWSASNSFSISFWLKKDGQTTNNLGGNGPEYIFSLRSNDVNYHWSNGILIVFIEGDNAAAAVKVMAVSPSDPADPTSSATDNWFTWEGGQTIAGLLNNNWRHIVITYDAATSEMKLFVDGVANPNTKSWNNHGGIRLATAKIGEYRIGRGPRNDDEGDGAGGWLQSSLKGSLDQLRLYDVVLTPAEIQSLFTNRL